MMNKKYANSAMVSVREDKFTTLIRQQRVYLAGPMRGIKDFNFPAFHHATKVLRDRNFEVFSAAEYEEELYGVGFNLSETGDLKDISMPNWDFREAYAKDCDYISRKADGVAVLPGWERSKGASGEVAIARALGLYVFEADTGLLIPPEAKQECHGAVAINNRGHRVGCECIGCLRSCGIGGAPNRAVILPEDSKERKRYPVASGLLDYFPDALAAVSHVSAVGNEQHSPGTPVHWDRSKSGDEADTMQRHFLERGSLDKDGLRHTAKMAWRALALLQKEIEKEAK